MKLSDDGEELIIRFEGFSSKPYICPAGYLTVGYGHLVKPGEDFSLGISQAEAHRLLERDVQGSCNAVNRLVTVPLEQCQFDALVSFVYNLGSGSFQRSTLRQKLNREDYEGAANEFSKWVYARGVKLAGLVLRREAERRMFVSATNQ